MVPMRVLSETAGFGAAIVLARLVTPADFGRAAIALIFIMLGDILCFEGFASVLVRRDSITEDDRKGAMFMSMLGGLLIAAAIFLLAGPVWTPLFGSQTAYLIKLVAPSILIMSTAAVSRSTLWRNLDFRVTSIVDAGAILVGGLVSIGYTIVGPGDVAIIVGALAGVVLSAVMFLIASPPPMPRWSRSSQRDITTFGIPAAFAGLAGVVFRNIDYAILATRLPAATVGLYYRAFNVSVVYQDKLSRIMSQIALPMYSRTEDRDALAALHERVARLHAVVIFPFLATGAVLAPVLVPLVFGPQWRGAIPATEILAVAGACAAVRTGYPQLMLALNKATALLWFTIASVVLYGGVVFLASRHGLVVIAFGVCGAYLLLLLGSYQVHLKPALGLSIARLLYELAPALAGCAALVIVDLGVRVALASYPLVVIAIAAGVAGMAAYGLVLYRFFPQAWADLASLVNRLVPRTKLTQLAGRTAVLSRRKKEVVPEPATTDPVGVQLTENDAEIGTANFGAVQSEPVVAARQW